MDVEILWIFLYELLKPQSRLVQMMGIVELQCFLKLTLKSFLLFLINSGTVGSGASTKNEQQQKRREPGGHSFRMLALPWELSSG
jgi:hypothetical protein